MLKVPDLRDLKIFPHLGMLYQKPLQHALLQGTKIRERTAQDMEVTGTQQKENRRGLQSPSCTAVLQAQKAARANRSKSPSREQMEFIGSIGSMNHLQCIYIYIGLLTHMSKLRMIAIVAYLQQKKTKTQLNAIKWDFSNGLSP